MGRWLGEPGEEEHFTDASPDYGLFSRPALISLGIAAGLVVATEGLMLVLRDTVVASVAIRIFALGPLVTALLFGISLAIGYRQGIKACAEERYLDALAACGLLAATYGVFGAGILRLFAPSLALAALAWATAITVSITLLAGAMVFTTDRSFEKWNRYGSGFMVSGVTSLILYEIGVWLSAPPDLLAFLLYLAFGLILLGWIAYLFYELQMISGRERTPSANGMGLYVGVMGVFVHVLQLVLRFLRRR